MRAAAFAKATAPRDVNLVLVEPSEVTAVGRDPRSGPGEPSGVVTLDGDRARHLLKVLNVTPGDTVRLGIIDGPLGVATVTGVGDATVTLQGEFTDMPPRPRVDLLLALPRPKVMRRLWAQLAAMGVGRIILTNAERVERNYFDTHVLTTACYRPLLIEGLQQARDTRLPQVTIHRQFRVLIEDELDGMVGDVTRVVADPMAIGWRSEWQRSPRSATLCRQALTHGCCWPLARKAAGTGLNWACWRVTGFSAPAWDRGRLRTDTACIALLALATHLRPET